MSKNKNIILNSEYPRKLKDKFFLLGFFLLPSVPPLGFLMLLISLILSILSKPYFNFDDKWNIPIFLSMGIIIFNTIYVSLINKPIELINFPISNIWVNLFNWIPFLIGFKWFQEYLNTHEKRYNFAKFLVSGTIPVLFSCFMQYVFKWEGPIELFNGFIVWFLKPVNAEGGISGLFSNTNYTGLWLVTTLPLSLFLIFINHKKAQNNKKFLLVLISLLIIFFIFQTNSRNALLGVLLSLNIIFGIKAIIFLIFAIITFSWLFNYLSLPIINLETLNTIIPETLISKFRDIKLDFYTPRILIWGIAISMILSKPLFGWGSGTFSFLYQNDNSFIPLLKINATHSHNLFFELSHNFGLPLSLLLTSTFLLLILKSFRKMYKCSDKFINSSINKYWLASTSVIIFGHFSDITFYDGRINLLFCILLSGTRCILKDYENRNLQNSDYLRKSKA